MIKTKALKEMITCNTIKLTYIKRCLLYIFICFSVKGLSQPVTAANFSADYPVIHPQFRQWPSPALNNVADCVSPTLLWPNNKKATGYDIRLSQDASFAADKTISKQNIQWTMYTPHRALNEGTWYWQYRQHDGKWSDVLAFRITGASNKNFSPPVEKMYAAIPAAHPRVLIDKSGQKTFSAQNKNTADAKMIIEEAAKLVKLAPPPETDAKSKLKGKSKAENDKIALVASSRASNKIYNAVHLFCKAYILTGDQKYAKKAIEWAMSVSGWDPNGLSLLSDFGDARCMLSMALALDTFYDQLTPSQKKILTDAIHIRADRFYHSWINNIDAKVLSNHVWQYIFHYFFQTAIAVYGETPDAANWINYAYELWLARAPVLGGDDGAWCEGASYFRLNMETLLDVPMIIKQYTGYDFIANKKWYELNPYWMAYSFPPGSSTDGFGDDVEKIYSPGTEYLAYADALSKLTGNKLAAWYAGEIERMGKNNTKTEERVNGVTSYKKSADDKLKLSDADMLRWFRMRYLYGVKRPDPIDVSTLSAAQKFPGTGVADMHSAITNRQNDVMVSMRSSPYGSYGHLLGDQNTFNVLVGGDRLFYMSGHKVAMQDPHRLGWYKATQGHNGILIDNKGQPFNSEAYGYLPRFIDGKNLGYVVGDASQAYSSQAEKEQTGLTKFRRHLLFLYPDILIVYDELEADHAAKWSWLIHSPYQIKIDAGKHAFYCNSEKVSANTSLFTTQNLQWNITDTFAVQAVNWLGREDEDGNLIEYKNDQWHLTAATTTNVDKIRFLAVMKINQHGEVNAAPVSYQLNSKGELIIDNWVIKAELDAAKPALLEAFNNDKRIAFTSGGDELKMGNETFNGKINGSSKLAEWIDGKYVFSEAGDVMPDAVKNIPVEKH
ncbi:Heparinase II/III-like protein [Parafilimonas terrae]|uniref:Heparinase II/III-like protein n=2 Tax=Parafilimonas terrae TaxID=1465490 RepID=A0A1I5Y210_9BACT|nr:Heparinase II/III-like protein [Parafilimonas terrae]